MPVAQAFYPRQGASDPASMRAGDAMPVEILEAPGMPTAASVEAPTFALGAKVMVNRGSGDESAGTVVALPGEDDFDVYEVQLDDTMAIEEYSPDQLRAAAEEPSDGNTSSPRYNERLSRARAGNSPRGTAAVTIGESKAGSVIQAPANGPSYDAAGPDMTLPRGPKKSPPPPPPPPPAPV